MSDDLKRIKLQQEANAAAIQRMQMQMNAQNARRADVEYEDEDEGRSGQAYLQQQQQQPPQQQQYQQVDPNQAMFEAIANHAANVAAHKVEQNLSATSDVRNKIEARMKRLVAEYPALQQDDSQLVIKARETYARIAAENPGLDEATRYELAVREAATRIGAVPVNAPVEDFNGDFVMPTGRNPAQATRSTKSRLTKNILANAQLMGINVDPNSVEGKKNLAELSEYSARFNADQDESQYRYK